MENLLLNQTTAVRKREVPKASIPTIGMNIMLSHFELGKELLATDEDQVHAQKVKNCLQRPVYPFLLQYRYMKHREHLPTKHQFQYTQQ
jgi:hypothetical protein